MAAMGSRVPVIKTIAQKERVAVRRAQVMIPFLAAKEVNLSCPVGSLRRSFMPALGAGAATIVPEFRKGCLRNLSLPKVRGLRYMITQVVDPLRLFVLIYVMASGGSLAFEGPNEDSAQESGQFSSL